MAPGVAALGRRALGQHDVVLVERKVIVVDRAGRLVPGDRAMVDQPLDRDQDAAEIEQVATRQVEFARRHAVGYGIAVDHDRPFRPVGAGDDAVPGADPADRLDDARQRHHPVAELERLDRHLAGVGQDVGAGAEAGDIAAKDGASREA